MESESIKNLKMTTFTSEPVTIQAPAGTVFNKLSNLENLRLLLDKVPADRIPDDKRAIFDNIEITPDSITIPGTPAGPLTLGVTERRDPTLIRLEGQGTPVPMSLSLELTPDGAACTGSVRIDLELPMLLKPMVAGPMKKVVDQFATVLGALHFE